MSSERQNWIQCTSVSNECLGGCASMREHDAYRQRELRAQLSAALADKAKAEQRAEKAEQAVMAWVESAPKNLTAKEAQLLKAVLGDDVEIRTSAQYSATWEAE